MIVRTVVTLAHASGLPEDRVVNVWHFRTPASALAPGDPATIQTRLNEFYSTAVPAASNTSIASWYSPFVAASGHTVTLYDEDAQVPRVPLSRLSITLVPGAGLSLPMEVALVLSYRSLSQPGVELGRTRGRIYLGPFRSGASADSAFDNRPGATLLAAVRGAAERLATASDGFVDWVVYSPTQRSLAPGESRSFTVAQGHVDNSWDTQRRRGRGSSFRELFGPV